MGKLPNKRSKPDNTVGLPPDVAQAEGDFYRCPKGHQLPNRTARGQCTPLWCANEEGAVGGGNKKKSDRSSTRNIREEQKEAVELVKAEIDPKIDAAIAKIPESLQGLVREQANQQKVDHVEKVGAALGRHIARTAFLSTPTGLKGGDAEKYFDEKIVELLPLAAAELEYQMKFGDDGQRMKATEKIMDATGRGKKENGAAAVAPMILVQGTVVQVPWRQADAKAVEGQVVEAKSLLEGESP